MAMRHDWATNPYVRLIRLHQPTGIGLLLWPCWWSVTLASTDLPSPLLLLAFAVGATLMRGAGCIINDLWDRDIDVHVARTRSRPLATGEISVREAQAALVVLLALSLLIALSMGWRVLMWSALSLPLVVIYPYMKRITWWPQAFLGLTFNWGALVGWVAVTGHVELPALVLYAAGFFWTLAYDTAYALQDTNDDALIGVKSSALRLGKYASHVIAMSYGLFFGLVLLAGKLTDAGALFYVGVGVAVGLVAGTLFRLDASQPYTGRNLFTTSGLLGGLVFLACLASSAF